MITSCAGCGKVLIASGYAVAQFDPRVGGFWLPPLDRAPERPYEIDVGLCPACRDDSDPGPATDYSEDADPLGGASIISDEDTGG